MDAVIRVVSYAESMTEPSTAEVSKEDQSDERPKPTGAYQPFPSFETFASLDVDLSTIDRYAELLRETREEAGPEGLERGLRTATRYAAVDTGAIEGLYETDRGFTRTIAAEAAAWEIALQARGETVVRAIDDALAAYDYVLDAATTSTEITEAWIRTLHEVICRSQATYAVYVPVGTQGRELTTQEHEFIKGRYKDQPNSPTNASTGSIHHYAPPLDTPAEMNRLVEELRSPAFCVANPVLQAAYAHYAFVCIHPFPDGNGRVSRALASVFLYRDPGVPLVVFADQKAEYLDALEQADAGNYSAFTSFLLQRAVDAVELVRLHTRERKAPPLSDSLEGLQRVMVGRFGLPHNEVDAVASRIYDHVMAEVGTQVAALSLPPNVQSTSNQSGGNHAPLASGYRMTFGGTRQGRVSLQGTPPADVGLTRAYQVEISKQEAGGADFLVTTNASGLESLGVSLREAHPVLTQVLQLKVTTWVEELISDLVADFRVQVEDHLRQQQLL